MGFLSDITGVTGARLASETRQDASRRENQNIATVGAAYDVARGAAQAGRDEWNSLAQFGADNLGTNQMVRDALGLNGPEGVARARGAFTAGPGYQHEIDTATDAVMRRQNAMGLLSSGNTVDAVRGAAQDQANRGWQTWLGNVAGLGTQGMQAAATAAGGRSAGWNNLANLATGAGRDSIGVTNAAGQQIAQANAGEAQARAAGAANLGGLILGGAQMFAGGLGGVTGGGGFAGLGKTLGSLGNYAGYGSGSPMFAQHPMG